MSFKDSEGFKFNQLICPGSFVSKLREFPSHPISIFLLTFLSPCFPYSRHFGPQIISAHLSLPASSPTIPLLHLKLYDDFIQAIDGIDNGIPQHPSSTPSYISKTDLSSRVAHLNPSWNETSSEEDSNLRFEKASSLAGGEFFDRLDYAFKSWLPAREIVENAIKDRVEKSGDKEGRVLVFDGYASWKDHLFSLEKVLQGGIEGKILYVVYPDESNKWRIQCVPESIDSFVSRKGLPEEWRGLRDQVLTEKMGIQGGIFVHASGFIGGEFSLLSFRF